MSQGVPNFIGIVQSYYRETHRWVKNFDSKSHGVPHFLAGTLELPHPPQWTCSPLQRGLEGGAAAACAGESRWLGLAVQLTQWEDSSAQRPAWEGRQ